MLNFSRISFKCITKHVFNITRPFESKYPIFWYIIGGFRRQRDVLWCTKIGVFEVGKYHYVFSFAIHFKLNEMATVYVGSSKPFILDASIYQ